MMISHTVVKFVFHENTFFTQGKNYKTQENHLDFLNRAFIALSSVRWEQLLSVQTVAILPLFHIARITLACVDRPNNLKFIVLR